MMYQYRYHNEPGCGGCLLFFLLITLLFGGAPMLFQVVGFLLFSGIFSIVLLMALFWGFTYFLKRKISTYERSQTEAHNQFVNLLVHILIKIAQIDGQVTKDELNTITSFFRNNLHYQYEQMLWLKELIKEAQKSTASLEELLQQFRSSFTYEPRLILLELVYQVVFSGEKHREPELELAQNIAEFLGINAYDHTSIRSRYMYRRQQTVSEDTAAYAALGLQKGATADEVKKAYRKLSMQYHPDKVAHLGEEFQRVAEEKMKEINAAYHLLKKNMAN